MSRPEIPQSREHGAQLERHALSTCANLLAAGHADFDRLICVDADAEAGYDRGHMAKMHSAKQSVRNLLSGIGRRLRVSFPFLPLSSACIRAYQFFSPSTALHRRNDESTGRLRDLTHSSSTNRTPQNNWTLFRSRPGRFLTVWRVENWQRLKVPMCKRLQAPRCSSRCKVPRQAPETCLPVCTPLFGRLCPLAAAGAVKNP
jgi:hypothetical protein